jgi:hypothetical protein
MKLLERITKPGSARLVDTIDFEYDTPTRARVTRFAERHGIKADAFSVHMLDGGGSTYGVNNNGFHYNGRYSLKLYKRG